MSGQAQIVIVGGGIAFQLAGARSGDVLVRTRGGRPDGGGYPVDGRSIPLPAGQVPSILAPVRPAEDFWAYATTRFECCKQLMGSATFATHLTEVSRSRAAP